MALGCLPFCCGIIPPKQNRTKAEDRKTIGGKVERVILSHWKIGEKSNHLTAALVIYMTISVDARKHDLVLGA